MNFTFWHRSDWEDVSDVKGSLLSAIDGLTGGCSLSGNKHFLGLSEDI